jgi:F-type H+-transporting ATPase subunit gamma
MANLREIRNRITTVKSTQQITKAMKMVAAARLKKAQDRVVALRPYAGKLKNVIGRLSTTIDSSSKLLTQVETPKSVLLIVIGSDRGLCGGFNSNLFRFAEEEIRVRFADVKENGQLHLITLGRKANDYFRRRGYTIVQSHNGFFDRVNYDATARITRQSTEWFMSGSYDAVHIIYNEFKSVIAQNRMVEAFLPVAPSETGDTNETGDCLFEPSSGEMMNNVLPLHLNTQLWRAVLESNASEQGARMAAMDNATENASAIIRELQLKYNQARQAAITTELSEIVSGAEALNG